ncbi:MAG: class I SAM-dependent RNA methyltransferase [Gemmatimonadota bacterium]|nr:class I SAM-dependent RNA methyltransferase [Gemmatimonadota bacterium]
MPESSLDLFSIAAPGLGPTVASELTSLGFAPRSTSHGGVAWRGSQRDLYTANLWLRSASRVLLRVTEFHAATFSELERRARAVPWGRFVRGRDRVRFRVTCHKSALYHSDAVAQRLAESVSATTGCSTVTDGPAVHGEEEDTVGEQLFVVRLDHDQLTLSADSSGTLLHKRGYRQVSAKAPLRETLAASILLASGWRGAAPLLDPMCGSGTLPIEAALLARRMAPGMRRSFRFERWPGFAQTEWLQLREQAQDSALPQALAPIVAADRDAGAIQATVSNAERAGVRADIEVVERALSESRTFGEGRGWVLTNPPYGVRVGTDVRNLYAALGGLMRRELKGWQLGVLVPTAELENQLGINFEQSFETKTGGIPVRFLIGGPVG